MRNVSPLSAIAAGKLRKKHQNIREKRQKQAATRDKRPIKTNLKVKPGKKTIRNIFLAPKQHNSLEKIRIWNNFFFMISNVPEQYPGRIFDTDLQAKNTNTLDKRRLRRTGTMQKGTLRWTKLSKKKNKINFLINIPGITPPTNEKKRFFFSLLLSISPTLSFS